MTWRGCWADGKAPKNVRAKAEGRLDELFAQAPRFGSYGRGGDGSGDRDMIDFHTLVWFWFVQPGEEVEDSSGRTGKWYRTTGGRVLFNSIIPDEMGFLNRTFGKKELGDLIFDCFTTVGLSRTTEFLDNLKDFGFRYATMGGVSVGVQDLEIPPEKIEDPAGRRRAGHPLPAGLLQRLHLQR